MTAPKGADSLPPHPDPLPPTGGRGELLRPCGRQREKRDWLKRGLQAVFPVRDVPVPAFLRTGSGQATRKAGLAQARTAKFTRLWRAVFPVRDVPVPAFLRTGRSCPHACFSAPGRGNAGYVMAHAENSANGADLPPPHPDPPALRFVRSALRAAYGHDLWPSMAAGSPQSGGEGNCEPANATKSRRAGCTYANHVV